jgi:ubiquilin
VKWKEIFLIFFAVFLKGSLAMGEEAEGGVDASGGSVTVHVRCSNGNKFSLSVDLTSTVRDLKMMLVERSEIPADQQRLIYKGRVLKDESSLDSYGAFFFFGPCVIGSVPPLPMELLFCDCYTFFYGCCFSRRDFG